MTWRLLGVLLVGSLFLGGCWSRIEINDLAIVAIVAMDRTEDGDLQVSLQIVIPQRIPRPGGSAGGGGPPVYVIGSTGRSVPEVIHKLQLQTSRRLFFAHTNVFLVGERLAAGGLEPVEDFLDRQHEIRFASYLMAVRGEARPMLQILPELDRLPVETLREIERSHAGLTTSLRHYVRDRRTEGKDPALVWVDAVPSVEGQAEGTRDFKLRGSALFAGDRLAGWQDDKATRGMMLLGGQRIVGTISAPMDGGGYVSAVIEQAKASVRAVWKGNRPAIECRVEITATLTDLERPVDVRDPKTLLELQRALEREVTAMIASSVEQDRLLGVDPSGFGWQAHRSNPQLWRRIGGRWRDEVRTVPVTPEVVVHVTATGLANRPRTASDGELTR